MKKKKKVLVLTDHMPWGHRSIAKAIYGYLSKNQDDFEVEYGEVRSSLGTWNDGYTFMYRYLPSINRLTLKLASMKVVEDVWADVTEKNEKGLWNLIKKSKPDLIISAYLVFNGTLVDLRKKRGLNFKLWTVVADPWTMVPQSYLKEADLHLVYDQVALGEGLRRRIPAEKILVTGWWTRSEMYKKYNSQKVRQKLGFTDNRPIIFVGGGSLGSNILAKFLPSLLFINKKVGFIFNTGTDKLALRLVKDTSKLLDRLKKKGMVQIKCFGWIDNMAEVLSACDIVFGKAGPNFLFDVVACQKPFVAVTHIGGQEDGNIDLIREKHLGWVREKPMQLSNFLLEYLKKPKKFEEKYKESISEEAKRNKNSMKIILNRLRKEFQI